MRGLEFRTGTILPVLPWTRAIWGDLSETNVCVHRLEATRQKCHRMSGAGDSLQFHRVIGLANRPTLMGRYKLVGHDSGTKTSSARRSQRHGVARSELYWSRSQWMQSSVRLLWGKMEIRCLVEAGNA